MALLFAWAACCSLAPATALAEKPFTSYAGVVPVHRAESDYDAPGQGEQEPGSSAPAPKLQDDDSAPLTPPPPRCPDGQIPVGDECWTPPTGTVLCPDGQVRQPDGTCEPPPPTDDPGEPGSGGPDGSGSGGVQVPVVPAGGVDTGGGGTAGIGVDSGLLTAGVLAAVGASAGLLLLRRGRGVDDPAEGGS
ncbi:hypothetical protein GCM10009533_51550 [Saccharopolyspora spinosporotrichia]|uniref:Uncharacterized protein n=1 Tax=Saccharopolyspora erythraea TaxID=1836 RepID=A0ABN1DL18_SACER